jgi:hypothetical protein
VKANWTVKKIPKYTTFKGADPMRKKKLNTDHTVTMVSTITITSNSAVEHTQHEEAKRVVVPNGVSTAVGLSYPEERSNDDSKAQVEQTKCTENCIGVRVAQYDFPLCGDHHADTCHAKEVAYERCRD